MNRSPHAGNYRDTLVELEWNFVTYEVIPVVGHRRLSPRLVKNNTVAHPPSSNWSFTAPVLHVVKDLITNA